MPLGRQLRIIIPGGTGQVGRILARHFHEQGHSVTVLSRHPVTVPWKVVPWEGLTLGPWTQTLDGADVVINLAGRSVNCRYDAANQRKIKLSRTVTTELVGRAIEQAAHPPPVWLNASTATIYRHSLDRPMDEITGELGRQAPNAPAKWRFSIAVARAWEETLFAAHVPQTRRIALRSAMTMSPDRGGVFDEFLKLVRWGLGGRLGSGKQYVSWIHDVDFVRAIDFLIRDERMEGPVNVSSPCPLPNSDFMCCLRKAWCTSYIGLPIPEFALTMGAVFMGTETELVLKSRRVVPRRLQEAGFDFHFPNWRSASQDLVQRWRQSHGD